MGWVEVTILGVFNGLVFFAVGRRYERRVELRRQRRVLGRWGDRP